MFLYARKIEYSTIINVFKSSSLYLIILFALIWVICLLQCIIIASDSVLVYNSKQRIWTFEFFKSLNFQS